MPNKSDDDRDIRALIGRQFKSMSWAEGATPDWSAFQRDFLPGALLHASARPVRAQSVEQFRERMTGLVGTSLRSLDEQVEGSTIRVFGNIAVAVAICATAENGDISDRTVEMMLLVKEAGEWRIAAQAWDKESPSNPISPALCDP